MFSLYGIYQIFRRTYYFSRNRRTRKLDTHLYYRNALIQCDNNGCNQKVSLTNLCNHIKFKCEHCIVQCPAIQCLITGKLNDMLTNSTPFHTVWSAGCKINSTVLATSHNCKKSK